MSPQQLAKQGTESGEQKALFAWARVAYWLGFAYANDERNYGKAVTLPNRPLIPALQWLHSIPNGGLRDIRTAARMKAEGLKPGIADIFLPWPIEGMHGLYIELKKSNGKSSDDQLAFQTYCLSVGYLHTFAFGWRQGANLIESYLS